MTTTLLYILFALPAAGSWQGSLELATFSSLESCERAAEQLQQVGGVSRYHCETAVLPASMSSLFVKQPVK
jgi:hypothetical protein